MNSHSRPFRVLTALALAVTLISSLGAFRFAPSSPSQQISTSYVPPAPAAVLYNLAYGGAPDQRLDLYFPQSPGPHKLIVFAHSGGWCCGDKNNLPMAMRDALGAGWAVASINYFRTNQVTRTGAFPTNVHDFKRATRWLRSNAAAYKLNPNMVVAAGASAGGHLAALAAATAGRTLEPAWSADLAAQRADYQGVVSLAGPVSLVRFYGGNAGFTPLLGEMLGCFTACTTARLKAASPTHNLTPNAPPAYLAYGGLDTLVVPGEAYDYEAQYKAVVPAGDRQVWVDVNPNQGHNIDIQGINVVELRRFLATVASGGFREPMGALDVAATTGPQQTVVAGWALDPDTTAPIAVHAYVDGRFAGAATANLYRGDVAAVYPNTGTLHGYSFALTKQAPGAHTVCLYGINVAVGSGNPALGCKSFTTPGGSPFGYTDGVSAVNGVRSLNGWAIDPDVADTIAVHAYVNGKWYGAWSANTARPDVGAAFPGYGNNHGWSVPLTNLPAGTSTMCVYGINVGVGGNSLIGCKSVTK